LVLEVAFVVFQRFMRADALWAHYESKWFFRDGEARPREPKVIDEGEAPEA
jgi:hypothetical protein